MIHIELFFSFYCDNYIVWASVCREWRDYIHKRVKNKRITISKHMYDTVDLFKWSNIQIENINYFIKHGTLKVIKYFLSTHEICHSRVCFAAIWGRLYDVVDILSNFQMTIHHMSMAGVEGDIKMLKKLLDLGCPYDVFFLSSEVALARNLHVFEWMHQNKIKIDKISYLYAITNDDENMINWLHRIQVPFMPGMTEVAITHQNQSIINLMRTLNCP